MGVDNEVVKELIIVAWNIESITKRIEATIKSMNKKDQSTIDVNKLANSSIIKKICTACIKEEDPNWKLDSATRKAFCQRLAQEMIESMPDYLD